MNPKSRFDEMLALLERLANDDDERLDPRLFYPLDLHSLYADDINETWLVDDLWPAGRHITIHAARKTGKSLQAMWIACHLAMGIDPYSGRVREPVCVAYLDLEMTRLDVKRRMFDDMEFVPDKLAPNLHYYLSPPFPPLDTKAGGERLLYNMREQQEKVLIIDTFSRVISGEENSNDTYINYYRHTGAILKADGISAARTDHEGWDAGRSRGASAKGDDVDIVWQLANMDGGGLVFNRKASRVADVPEHFYVERQDEPSLSFRRAIERTYVAGTMEKADELDAIGVPLDASQRIAKIMLREAGKPVGRMAVLQSALNFRRDKLFVQ